LTTILYAIYSAIFPYFFSEEAVLKTETDPQSLTCRLSDALKRWLDKHPTLARAKAIFVLDYYMPIVHPIRWWRQTNAINQLLELIGWPDVYNENSDQ